MRRRSDAIEEGRQTLKTRIRAAATLAAIGAALVATAAASASGTRVVVTPDTSTWAQDDTRPGGAVAFTTALGAPAGFGTGALELTTDATNEAKAGLYTHTMAGTKLADLGALSYWTKQAAASCACGDASFQLQVDVDGTPGDGTGFTTLVYEPYWNGTVTPGAWEQWDVSGGEFWSSRTTPDLGNGQLTGMAGGPATYSLADVTGMYPDAVVLGIGVNAGTFNPSYDVGVDGIAVGDTTYDFEPGTACSTSTSDQTITLLADCTETSTWSVPDGYTLDGDGHTLTAADPSASTAFVGAAVQSTGASMTVKNLHIVGASSVVDCREFTGIRFDGAGGSVTGSSVDSMLRGGYTGCQNGLGIYARNLTDTPRTLTIDGNTVTRYNKNGITVNGNYTAAVTNNTLTGAGPLDLGFAAQNGIQIGFGASALVSGNTVSGNDYTPQGDVACGLLVYEANGVKQRANVLFANERDFCNFGRGGGSVSR